METTERPSLPLDAWALAVIAASALIVVGSIGTWVDAGIATVSGLRTDGKATVVAGILGLSLAAPRPWHRAPGVLAAAVSLGVSAWFVARVLALQDGSELITVSIGWGLALVTVGSVALTALALWQLPNAKLRIVGLVVAVAIAAASAAWGASVGSNDLVDADSAKVEMPEIETPKFEPIPEIPEIPEVDDTTTPTDDPVPARGLPCSDLSYGENVSCQFAKAVADRYVDLRDQGRTDPVTLRAFSEAVGSSIEMVCAVQDGEAVMCTGGNEAVISIPLAAR